MSNQDELSWEEAACTTLQKSEKLFSSAEEILQSIISNKLRSDCLDIDRRALEAILLCFSRGSSCKLVASSRKLNGHSRETLRFALKEEMDSHMFHFVDVDLTEAELELIKLNGIVPQESLHRESSKKALCVIRAPYSSQHLDKKVPVKNKNNGQSLQNGHVKPLNPKPVKQPSANISTASEKTAIPVNNPSSKYFQLLQSPNSPLVTANLKNLINETVFDELPIHIQEELLTHLPDCDDSVSALLNNEFFSSALETFRNHLADGLFQATDFCESVIAPDKEPPIKILCNNEDEHYNITAVSPTKIRIAKSYANEPSSKTGKAKDFVATTSNRNNWSNRKMSHSTPLLQNERVTALKRPTRPRKSADHKQNTSNALQASGNGSDNRFIQTHRSVRHIGQTTLKTKCSQQAILHTIQNRPSTGDSKAKRSATGSSGKPSVRFTVPPVPTLIKPSNTMTSEAVLNVLLTKTLASAKVLRKRKLTSFSWNNLWLPQSSVHGEWIEMSDDDIDCSPSGSQCLSPNAIPVNSNLNLKPCSSSDGGKSKSKSASAAQSCSLSALNASTELSPTSHSDELSQQPSATKVPKFVGSNDDQSITFPHSTNSKGSFSVPNISNNNGTDRSLPNGTISDAHCSGTESALDTPGDAKMGTPASLSMKTSTVQAQDSAVASRTESDEVTLFSSINRVPISTRNSAKSLKEEGPVASSDSQSPAGPVDTHLLNSSPVPLNGMGSLTHKEVPHSAGYPRPDESPTAMDEDTESEMKECGGSCDVDVSENNSKPGVRSGGLDDDFNDSLQLVHHPHSSASSNSLTSSASSSAYTLCSFSSKSDVTTAAPVSGSGDDALVSNANCLSLSDTNVNVLSSSFVDTTTTTEMLVSAVVAASCGISDTQKSSNFANN